MNIGINIRKYRLLRDITSEELAKAVGVSPATVHNWENNQSYPDIPFYPRIAAALGISIDKIFDYSAEDKRLDFIEPKNYSDYAYEKFVGSFDKLSLNDLSSSSAHFEERQKRRLDYLESDRMACIVRDRGTVFVSKKISFIDKKYLTFRSGEAFSNKEALRFLKIIADEDNLKIFKFLCSCLAAGDEAYYSVEQISEATGIIPRFLRPELYSLEEEKILECQKDGRAFCFRMNIIRGAYISAVCVLAESGASNDVWQELIIDKNKKEVKRYEQT